mmetsp:Transcript_2975/g.5424  ORF Transcript_2975/g.5424 Transcript_2975/m.5424 type:complete len:216 (-) Transcript_2975:3-650(-)
MQSMIGATCNVILQRQELRHLEIMQPLRAGAELAQQSVRVLGHSVPLCWNLQLPLFEVGARSKVLLPPPALRRLPRPCLNLLDNGSLSLLVLNDITKEMETHKRHRQIFGMDRSSVFENNNRHTFCVRVQRSCGCSWGCSNGMQLMRLPEAGVLAEPATADADAAAGLLLWLRSGSFTHFRHPGGSSYGQLKPRAMSTLVNILPNCAQPVTLSPH